MNERAIVRQPTLSFEGSQIALRAAERKAAELEFPMCIAIVDAGGHLLAFSRMQGARIGNIKLALTKAVSAAMRQRATAAELALRPDDVSHAIRMALTAGPDMMTSMSGGLPIVIDGVVVGGIGVSNGRRDQDIAVGQAGIDALLAE
jgi:glc operon protein GlcG